MGGVGVQHCRRKVLSICELSSQGSEETGLSSFREGIKPLSLKIALQIWHLQVKNKCNLVPKFSVYSEILQHYLPSAKLQMDTVACLCTSRCE